MESARRYLAGQVERDLERKMVFVAGPRQVGKTTLARTLPGADDGYLNWDVAEDRERILRRELPPANLWVFDEIHKYRDWRNYLKGLYDAQPLDWRAGAAAGPRTGATPAADPSRPGARILVTGSARLDAYRFGGDSLQGRFHLLRLHPLSAAELDLRTAAELRDLLLLGGFPEPYFGGSEVEARRWSREHRTLLIREEVASLERIQDLGRLELLMLRLPELVGSPLSINAVREDLQVSHKTAAAWLAVFERLYAVFRLSPFGAPTIRAVKKQQKHYHVDWSVVPEEPLRFENLVACHLLKWVHHRQDTRGLDLELRYFRDTDGREVDFVVTDRQRPVLCVECKWADGRLDKSLRYFKVRFPDCEAWQVSASGTKDFVTPEGIRVAPALELLGRLV